MGLTSKHNNSELAAALLDIVPKLLRRIRADIPLSAEASDIDPGWREVASAKLAERVSILRATPGQLSLLRTLVEHQRCTMQDLAEYLAVAPSTVTAMVKRLLSQGYIERSRDDTDWRTVWVTATSLGRQVVSVYQQARLATVQRRLEQLSEDECASILAALPALYHLIEVQA